MTSTEMSRAFLQAEFARLVMAKRRGSNWHKGWEIATLTDRIMFSISRTYKLEGI